MSPEPDSIESIFHAACAIEDRAKRGAYLEQACAGRQGLRERVDALLAAHEQAGSFLAMNFEEEAGKGREEEGAIIGRYKLLQQIGRGGFGTVWMAEQKEPVKRRVALKIINLGMDTKQVIARFEAERQALALMDHPNIAKVLDAGATETGRPYFVMELVRGVGLVEYCDREKLDTGARLGLFIDVCHAIQHAHQKGIIHRDIKPSNILVTLHDGKPVPKVIDFGIAKATSLELTTKTLFTTYGQMIGTPAYMSPEQAEMSGLDIDTRSDVYSLGVLLYELLTGTTPFDGSELMRQGLVEMLRVIRDVEPEKPSTRMSSLETAATTAGRQQAGPKRLGVLLRGDLDWIVMRCLEKDRSRRYETANGLAMDVARHLNGEAVQAVPPSVAYRLRKFARRNKSLVTAGLVVAGALVAGLCGTLWQAAEATRQADRAAERATAAEVAEAEQRRLRLEAEAARVAESEERAAAQKAKDAEAAQRKVAETNAATAAKVTAYIQGMLASADPHAAPKGPNYTVREMLEEVARDLGSQLEGEPEIELAIRVTIAKAYRSLGRLDDADRQLDLAMNLAAKTGIESLRLGVLVERAQVLHDRGKYSAAVDVYREVLARGAAMGTQDVGWLRMLGDVLGHQGVHEEAERVAREALAIARRKYGEESPHLASCLHALGNVLHEQGKLEEAETVFKEAWTRNCKLHGAEHCDSVASLSNLAVVISEAGRRSEAEPLHRSVLANKRRLFGDDHPETTSSMRLLAESLRGQGRLAEAEDLARQALALIQKAHGDAQAEIAWCQFDLAGMLQEQGKLDEAEGLFRESLSLRRQAFGEDHPYVAASMLSLGGVFIEERKFAEAEPLLREALDILRGLSGNENRHVADALNSLGMTLSNQGKWQEGEALLRQSLALRRKLHGEEYVTVGSSLTNLGYSLAAQGRFEEAEDLLRRGLAIWRKGFGDEHDRIATGLSNFGAFLLERGRPAESEALYRESLAIRRKLHGRESIEAVKTMTGFTGALRALEKSEEAESVCREALAVSRKILGDQHAMTASCLRNLAICLGENAKLAESEEILRRVLETRRKLFGDGHSEVATSLYDLGLVLTRQNRSEEAVDFFQKALAARPGLSGNSLGLGSTLRALAECLEKLGRSQESLPVRREWLALIRGIEKPGSPNLEWAVTTLASLLLKSGTHRDAAEAEPLLRETLEMRRRLYSEGHEKRWLIFSAMARVGKALAAQSRFPEAEPFLIGGYEGMKDDPKTEPRLRRDALEAIVRLYASWDEVDSGKGYDARSADWRRRLSELGPESAPASRPESRR